MANWLYNVEFINKLPNAAWYAYVVGECDE